MIITVQMAEGEKMIVLDADVISHFIKGELLLKLPVIYPGRLIILDIIKKEISERKGWESVINRFFKESDARQINFPELIEYLSEYAHLTSSRGYALGKGESACMVYCRFNDAILASSNLKDIYRYCDFHNIEHITTKDILLDGYHKGILTEEVCDNFIRLIKERGSKFPYPNLRAFLNEGT